MRVLAITNMYPSKERPASGTFVHQQVKGLTGIGVDIKVMVVDRAGRGWYAYCGIGREAAKRLVSCKCELVHVMYGGVMARNVVRAVQRVPKVVSICGSDLLGTAGRWPVAPLRSWVSRAASIKACQAAEAIVVKSEGLAKALPATIDSGKIHIIPNGIDLELFKPLERDGCLNQLGWDKDAFHVVFSRPEDPLTKRLELAQQSVALCRKLGIGAQLHLLKGVPHESVPFYLNGGNVLLLTSRHEGSPNIVKEALACNMPIVSVDVGDVAERIRGIAGCHIVGPEPELIALKLKEVAVRYSRIEGRIRVVHLSVGKVAERLAAIYGSLLERKRLEQN